MKKIFILLILAGFLISLTGCGETVNGVSKDIKRVGKGIRTIFVRDGG